VSGYGSLRASRRAFLTVVALRWLPTGLLTPVSVLFAIERGLSLAQVGLFWTVQGAVVILLELPTGALADAWGRRAVLVAGALFALGYLVVLLAAHSLPVFLVAAVLNGIFRALDSGPLEAWYVDAALAAEPDRDLPRDLSRAGGVLYAAVATGSITASGVVLLDRLPVSPLTAVVAASLAFQLVHLVALVLLVRERRAGTPGKGWRAARDAATAVPRVIGAGTVLGWRSRPLRLLLAVELAWGAGLGGFELLWQPRAHEALGARAGLWVFGVLAAGGWLAGAAGSALLPPLIRLLRGRVAAAAALLRVVQGLALLPMAVFGGVAAVAVAFLSFYVVHGIANPAHFALLHRRIGPGHRATVLSLNSLVSKFGALPATVALGALADGAGLTAALLVTAALLAAPTPLYLASGEPPPVARVPAPVDDYRPVVT